MDLFDVGAPDDAVARRDHLDRQVLERLEGRLCLTAVEREDVGVVLLGLVVEHGEVVLVVEAAAGGEVLAEGVVREEDLLLGAVGDHAVGPVEHRGRHELQRALAEGERVAGLDALVGQVAVAGLSPLRPCGMLVMTLAFGQCAIMKGREPEWSGSTWLEMM